MVPVVVIPLPLPAAGLNDSQACHAGPQTATGKPTRFPALAAVAWFRRGLHFASRIRLWIRDDFGSKRQNAPEQLFSNADRRPAGTPMISAAALALMIDFSEAVAFQTTTMNATRPAAQKREEISWLVCLVARRREDPFSPNEQLSGGQEPPLPLDFDHDAIGSCTFAAAACWLRER